MSVRVPLITNPGTLPPTIPPNEVPPTNPYRVVIASLDGTWLNEVPAKNLNYSFALNGPGSCSFTIPLRHPLSTRTLVDPAARSVEIWREQTRVWSGPIWSVNASKDGDVQIGAQGWFSSLRKRSIDQDLTYTNKEQLDLAWDLINRTQQKAYGDLGIKRFSTAPSGIVDDMTYHAEERKNLGDALSELAAQINGFDFEIDADRNWKTYFPQKGTTILTPFDLEKNISGISWVLDGSNIATEVTAVGGQDKNSKTLISVASDVKSQKRYGLLQGSTSYSDVIVQATLDRHAQDDLNNMKLPTDNPQLQVFTNDPPFGSYLTGDTVYINAHDGYIDIDHVPYRITAIVDAVSEEGRDNVGVFFDPTDEGQ